MRALTLALVLSGLLNVGLLGGALFGLFAAEEAERDPQAHIAAVAEALDLNAAQVEGLRAFRRETLEGLAARRSDGDAGVRDRLVEMLDDASYDGDTVREILNARALERNAFWAEVGADLHAWVATLPEDKQARFVEMAKDKGFFRKLFARDD